MFKKDSLIEKKFFQKWCITLIKLSLCARKTSFNLSKFILKLQYFLHQSLKHKFLSSSMQIKSPQAPIIVTSRELSLSLSEIEFWRKVKWGVENLCVFLFVVNFLSFPVKCFTQGIRKEDWRKVKKSRGNFLIVELTIEHKISIKFIFTLGTFTHFFLPPSIIALNFLYIWILLRYKKMKNREDVKIVRVNLMFQGSSSAWFFDFFFSFFNLFLLFLFKRTRFLANDPERLLPTSILLRYILHINRNSDFVISFFSTIMIRGTTNTTLKKNGNFFVEHLLRISILRRKKQRIVCITVLISESAIKEMFQNTHKLDIFSLFFSFFLIMSLFCWIYLYDTLQFLFYVVSKIFDLIIIIENLTKFSLSQVQCLFIT